MQCVSIGCKKKIPDTKKHYEQFGRYCRECCMTPVLHKKLGVLKDNTDYDELAVKVAKELQEPVHIELML